MLILLSISVFLFIILAIGSVFKKHKKSYLQGNISRADLLRNIILDTLGILLAMTLAGLLARQISQITITQINHSLLRLMTGILVGTLVGTGVGLLVKRFWGRLTRT